MIYIDNKLFYFYFLKWIIIDEYCQSDKCNLNIVIIGVIQTNLWFAIL